MVSPMQALDELFLSCYWAFHMLCFLLTPIRSYNPAKSV